MPMMSIEEILLLPSIDSIDFHCGELDLVRDALEYKYISQPEYREISRAMVKDGQTFAIHIADGETMWHTYSSEISPEIACPEKYRGKLVMGNGHHRVKIAIELGWTEMKYSEDVRYTGDDWTSG